MVKIISKMRFFFIDTLVDLRYLSFLISKFRVFLLFVTKYENKNVKKKYTLV